MKRILFSLLTILSISLIASDYNEFPTRDELGYSIDKVNNNPVIAKGGWRNPNYYELYAIPGTNADTTLTQEIRNGTDQFVGDTYRLVSQNSVNSSIILGINSEYRDDKHAIIEGTWSIDEMIPEDSVELHDNVVVSKGTESLFIARFTDTTGNSKTIVSSITGYIGKTNILNNLVKDVDGSWRRDYTKKIYDKFAEASWGTGPYYIGCIDHNPINSSCMRWPREIDLWQNYGSIVKYTTGKFSNIGWGKGTFLSKLCVTNFIPGTYPIETSSTHYTNSIISFARNPTEPNRRFFWAELQDALRCTSANRSEWYADMPIVLVAPHYALIAAHTIKNNSFKFSNGTNVNTFATVRFYGGKNLSNNAIKLYNDFALIRLDVTNGIPSGHPVAKFLGTYGNENYSSLYHLSTTLGDKIPAITVTQHATVNPVILNIKSIDRIRSLKSNPNYNSENNTFKTTSGYMVDLSKWSDPTQTTNQYAELVSGKWNTSVHEVNGVNITPNPGVTESRNYDWITGNPITYFSEYCPSMAVDDTLNNPIRSINPDYNNEVVNWKYNTTARIPIGHHYIAHGFDSGYPTFLYYNNQLILVDVYHTTGGGDSMLDPVFQDIIDQVMVQDSIKYFGSEEHITRVNCCDLDPEHHYHVH